jgi:hypothetical protein
MIRAKPIKNLSPEGDCQLPHFVGLAIGDHAGALVAEDVSLLAKSIETADQPLRGPDGQSQRLDDMVVPLFSGGTVTARGKGRCRCQTSLVVRDGEPGVGAEPFGVAIGEVTVDDGEQIGDLVLRRLVCYQPAVSRPVGQAHLRLPQRKCRAPAGRLSESGVRS